jgi:hypothetical protein
MSKRPPTIKQYDKLIQGYIDNKDLVKIFRTVTDGEANIHGFIIAMSKTFLLIQKEEEFYLNGYAIIRKDHFDALRSNNYEKTFKKILSQEGMLKEYGLSKKISITSWASIFKALKKLDFHVIVECEDLEVPQFLIGPLTKVHREFVSIKNYDPTGRLDKRSTKVKYNDITIVKFDDRYLNVFRKYLKPSR